MSGGPKPGEVIEFAYLYSAPFHGKRHFGIIHTSDGWTPEWWASRRKRDIRVTPLTPDDLKHPLIDIIRAHVHKLNDPEPPPKPAPPAQLPPVKPPE